MSTGLWPLIGGPLLPLANNPAGSPTSLHLLVTAAGTRAVAVPCVGTPRPSRSTCPFDASLHSQDSFSHLLACVATPRPLVTTHTHACAPPPGAAGRELVKEPITQEDFMQAIHKINPSVSQTDIKRHQEWLTIYGSV